MNTIESLPDGCLLIPALMEGAAYRSALSIHSPELRPIDLDSVRYSISASHDCIQSLVLWDGDYRSSLILAHRIPTEGDYIVLDDEGKLLGSSELDRIPGSEVVLFSTEAIDTTEGIWPEQRVPIATDYIETVLSGYKSNRMSWLAESSRSDWESWG